LLPQKTGLSACIFFAYGKKGYRFYPLRGYAAGPELNPDSGAGNKFDHFFEHLIKNNIK
jgi:hypothetical protein